MSARLLKLLAAAALATAPVVVAKAAEPAVPFKIEAVDVTLPEDVLAFPEGTGAGAATANCLACHSSEMILNQPKLSQKGWDGIVHKMINVYKAPVDEKDVPAIVEYLATLRR